MNLQDIKDYLTFAKNTNLGILLVSSFVLFLKYFPSIVKEWVFTWFDISNKIKKK